MEDSMFAIGWAADNARRWNGDGRRIAIGGDSAGANLAVSAITSSAADLRSLVRGGQRSSTAHTISRPPPSATDRCPDFKSN